MKRIIGRLLTVWLCLACTMLGGCWDQKIFEDIGFILQIGLELNQNGELVYSVTMPVVIEEAKEKSEILSVSDPLLRGCREKIRNVAGKRVEGGKTQVIHISRELAQQGICNLFDLFFRSPENPLLANVTVVDGSPNEMFLLSQEYKDKPRPAMYVTDLLENARKNGYTPETRIYEFCILSESRTIDPITPLIRYDDKAMEIAGSALFNRDKMVGEINRTQTGLLNMLMGDTLNFHYTYQGEEAKTNSPAAHRGIAILVKKAGRKMNLQMGEDPPLIDVQLKITATLEEDEGTHHLEDPQTKKQLEKDLAASIEKDCQSLLAYLQEIGSDPVGFGEMVRARTGSQFSAEAWKKVYSHISFQVKAEVNLEYYGAAN